MKLPKFFNWNEFDPIQEGVMAHEIKDEKLRLEIADNYNKLYRPAMTPFTHPEKYDPLNPPKGWAYDPYYECWIQRDE
jgi:hypothetical protein